MTNKTFKVVALLLVLVMAFSIFAGCQPKTEDPVEPVETEATTENNETTEEPTEAPEELPTYVAYEFDKRVDAERSETPLVVGYVEFNEKFSPFFSDSGYDQDVSTMCHSSLLINDRQGAVVYNGIEGETINYNGEDYFYTNISSVEVEYDEESDITTYLWTIRDDVQFADGEYMDADDIIFSYYVLIDPAYDGSSTLYSSPILGLNSYRLQISEEALEWITELDAAGRDNTDFAAWTEEQQARYWELYDEMWKEDIQAISDYCFANYFDYYGDAYAMIPQDIVDIAADTPGVQMAASLPLWGYGSVAEGVLTAAGTGASWDLTAGEYPTVDDVLEVYKNLYDGDAAAYAAVESILGSNPADLARDAMLGESSDLFEAAEVKSIRGIEKLNDYQVRVSVEGFDATAIYKLGITVAPMHYYGDEALYDYENGMYGFPFGDLTIVKEKTTMPMGAGPYKFIKFENKVVYFEANENYYKGEPLITNLQFKVTQQADVIPGVNTGAIDIGEPSFGDAEIAEIKSYNSNGELDGDKIETVTVDNLGYGYIGMNANNVNVGGEGGSDASKNLRKAFATLFAVYRDVSVASYYGDRASVINYPISNTSWAAPQKADEGYELAFSRDVDGNAIYTSDMDQEAKYAAALEAAIGFFKAAGYTWDEAAGMFTAAPDGALMTYELMIGGDGAGDHPVYELVTDTAAALEPIGITLIIRDIAFSEILEVKDAGDMEMVAMAWGATIDPDMYQIYHSESAGNDTYYIADPELDELIIAARTSPDQSYRKAVYKECLDIIIDWAVEVPTYQRMNCNVFSPERVNIDTLTPAITTFWGWANDIELLEMN